MINLSDEALGAIMLALQKSLIEKSDIIPVLKNFEFKIGDKDELYIMNPPILKLDNEYDEEEVGI